MSSCCFCIRLPVDPRLIYVFKKLSRSTSCKSVPAFALFSKLGVATWAASIGLNSLMIAGPMEVCLTIAGWPGVMPTVFSEPMMWALSLLLPHSMPLWARGDDTWFLLIYLKAFSIGAVCMWCSTLFCLIFVLPMGDGDISFWTREDLTGNANCLIKVAAGGQTRVETGICFGIGTRQKKSWSSISYKLIRFDRSTVRHLRIKSFAYDPIVICSGNENAPALIFLYVYFTSWDSKGGLPFNMVYRMTPIDQWSTS